MNALRVLNVGSGPPGLSRLHSGFRRPGWSEVRLDIDASVAPDIVADMVDMGTVADASFDALWSSHNVEHLAAHDVPRALGEWVRVLRPAGFALATCPDVEAVARFLLEHGLDAVAYESPAGPITARDMLFGHGASIAAGHGFMRHQTGFSAEALGQAALDAGFGEVRVGRRGFALWALCLMPAAVAAEVEALFADTPERMLFRDEEPAPERRASA